MASDLKVLQTVSEDRIGVNMGRAEINLKIQLHFHRKIEDVEVRLKGDPNGKLRKDRNNNVQG